MVRSGGDTNKWRDNRAALGLCVEKECVKEVVFDPLHPNLRRCWDHRFKRAGEKSEKRKQLALAKAPGLCSVASCQNQKPPGVKLCWRCLDRSLYDTTSVEIEGYGVVLDLASWWEEHGPYMRKQRKVDYRKVAA
jgi:hypothetical protein